MKKIDSILKQNSYPGRGIVLGVSKNSRFAFIAYFIMGRSVNSRNRVFALCGDDLKTKPYDEKKVVDPSLIIYHPIRTLGGITIVSNGDQTETITKYLKEGKTFIDALKTRKFEPDAPNFTPRISAMLKLNDVGLEYSISIIKKLSQEDCVQRNFFEYPQPAAGMGHFIHTYTQDADPLPSFIGEPIQIEIDNNLKDFGDHIWESLDSENKISLFTRSIEIKSGRKQTRIINKYH